MLRRTVVRCAQARRRCRRPLWCRAARLRQRRRVAQQWLGGSAVASFHVRQVHRQAVAPVPALSTAAAARPRHRPRRSSKAAHVGVAHATRHGTEFPDDAGGPVVHRLQRLPVQHQAPHNELSAGAPKRNGAVHHDGPTASVPVKRQRALHEFRTARVRRHRQKPAADAVAAHRQPRPGHKRRRPPQHQQRAIGQRTGVVVHYDGGRVGLHPAVEHQSMRGVHLAPRHAQHSAPRRHHARTRIQRIFATEHSRVQRDTATDKLQHGAVHHHRPSTSHHGHEGHAGHNQHGPHKPQARKHQHRCVRRGLRAEKIHKRRRPRGNQQGVGHRQRGPRGKRAGQHKRTVQRLHIAHGQLHRPALVAPRRTRTAQRSTAHHVQHGAVQQRHVLHNNPHAVPRHPRHVEHRTHAVQHNVAQRHLARAGRHNEHRLHRHALADEHTRRRCPQQAAVRELPQARTPRRTRRCRTRTRTHRPSCSPSPSRARSSACPCRRRRTQQRRCSQRRQNQRLRTPPPSTGHVHQRRCTPPSNAPQPQATGSPTASVAAALGCAQSSACSQKRSRRQQRRASPSRRRRARCPSPAASTRHPGSPSNQTQPRSPPSTKSRSAQAPQRSPTRSQPHAQTPRARTAGSRCQQTPPRSRRWPQHRPPPTRTAPAPSAPTARPRTAHRATTAPRRQPPTRQQRRGTPPLHACARCSARSPSDSPCAAQGTRTRRQGRRRRGTQHAHLRSAPSPPQ
ncbi:hypothetical protein ECC02_007453 [Trypanosoma cruzi]|uniref:Uncharacterized protein n=1 Tax=Trypanosoma cruzi TaxID=5693 RepID=A0A7J6XYK5_TRYCR|nr:hypothetical protein ECC02_007453 [Trypanosoma cruzi]